MASKKRTPIEREDDLRQIAMMYLQGKTQAAIGALLGLSQKQISYDLADIRARWRKETTYNLDEHKAQELARLDAIERECWIAWEKSKNNRVRIKRERDLTLDIPMSRLTREVEKRDGNPAFLAGVMSCIQERCKLLGLYPVKGEQKPVEEAQPTDLSGLSAEDLDTLERISAKVHDGAR